MGNRLIIEISDDLDIYVKPVDYDTGTVTKKRITMEELLEVLHVSNEYRTISKKGEMTGSSTLFRTPIFSSFNGSFTIQYIAQTNDLHYAVLQRLPGPHAFAVHDKVYNNVGLPGLVFVVKIYKDLIQSCNIGAIKERVVKEDTPIYRYPFTNAYGDGKICFGQNDMKNHKLQNGFTDLQSFPSKFFLMPSTHSMGQQNRYDMELRPLVEYLVDKEFDEEKLVPFLSSSSMISKQYTYREWIEDITNN
jgi:hypothetical protein